MSPGKKKDRKRTELTYYQKLLIVLRGIASTDNRIITMRIKLMKRDPDVNFRK